MKILHLSDEIPQQGEVLAAAQNIDQNSVADGTVVEPRNRFGPKEESVSGEPEVLAALEDLLDEVGGNVGGETAEGELEVVVGAPVVTEDAGDIVDQVRQWQRQVWLLGRERRKSSASEKRMQCLRRGRGEEPHSHGVRDQTELREK